MKFEFNDGGRAEAGFKGIAGDCAVRAVAIATGKPYKDVYDELNVFCNAEKKSKTRRGKSSSRTGVHSVTLNLYMKSLGWDWVPTMLFGQGCKVHMRERELPSGNIVARLSKHFAAVVDGVCHDTYDSTRDGGRCVYGYWVKAYRLTENEEVEEFDFDNCVLTKAGDSVIDSVKEAFDGTE